MRTFAGFALGLALLAAVPALVICVDLLLIPQLWPLDVDGWSLSMVKAAALIAGALGVLGGGLSLASWSNKVLAAGLAVGAVLPAVIFLVAGDQLALGAVAQLGPDGVGSVTQRYPHLKAEIGELHASRTADPYLAYLTRLKAAATQAERKVLAEAELARVLALPPQQRLIGLQRLSMSSVREIAHPTAAALRLELHGPKPGPPGHKALQRLVIGAIDRGTPLNERGVTIKQSDATPKRFRSKDFWTTCNVSGRANAAGLLFRGTAGRLILHRTATVGEATYTYTVAKSGKVKKTGEERRVQYPIFSGYAAVIDADGKEIYRHEVPAGSSKPDARFMRSAGDDLEHKLWESLSADFCLKISKPFGGF